MRRYKVDDKEFSEINITPFTDVILVVLIIFMIASPILISGAMKINLPKASSSESTVNDDIQIYLNNKDQLFLDDHIENISQLPSDLESDFMKKNNRVVIVKADKDAVYGTVVNLFDIIKNSGAEKLLIATSKN